ncbi:hypothetical protein L1049_012705 [Liquidambar formosana]|uniref:Uncharacterized protein n=1 Tax=Liquidambar formosana TaxID=63359 RepID=A0AAP0RJY7_LIQFO
MDFCCYVVSLSFGQTLETVLCAFDVDGQDAVTVVGYPLGGDTISEMKGVVSCIESIPRVVVFGQRTKTSILQWPVEEVESLRLTSVEFKGVELAPGSIVPLNIGTTTDQLNITGEFEIDKEALAKTVHNDATDDCSSGAVEKGSFGPFGLLIANKTLFELTPINFYIAKTQ